MRSPRIAKKIQYSSILLWAILGIVSCKIRQDNATTPQITSNSSFNGESKKLIAHYSKQKKDTLKLEAAKFLIKNMPGNQTHSYDFGKAKDHFCISISKAKSDTTLDLNSRENRIKTITENKELRQEFGSINYTEDTQTIRAEDLITNIDYAFAARETYPWCKNIKWNDFLNYVLPPKIYNEQYNKYWRRDIMKKYNWVLDSLKNETSLEKVALYINKFIANDIKYDPTLRFVPNILNYYDLLKLKVGKCEHLVTYNVYILRALGIPAMVDYTPAWANNSSGHTWGSIKTETGKIITFDALYPEANKIPSNKIPEGILRKRKSAKIYRITYKITETSKQKVDTTAPKEFYDNHTQDVTSEYDIEQIKTFSLTINRDMGSKPLFLCVYNTNSWIPAAIGNKQNNKTYLFKDVGTDIMYLTAIKDGGSYRPVSQPFVLNQSGKLHFYNPGGQIKKPIVLNRKSVIDYDLNLALNQLIGGQIQGSNTANFSSPITLHKIEKTPKPNYNIYKVSNRSSFRYFRYIQPNLKCRLAELSFFGKTTRDLVNGHSIQRSKIAKLEGTFIASPHNMKNDPSKSQDEDILTYYVSDTVQNGHLGIDLGRDRKAMLQYVKLYPPNDGNSIIPGDMYELFYWKDKWHSLGNIVAKDEKLTYNNYPKNAVFRLKNLTRGYKERIFTIHDGKQIWW